LDRAWVRRQSANVFGLILRDLGRFGKNSSVQSTPSSTTTRKELDCTASATRSSAVQPRHDVMDSPTSSLPPSVPRRTVTTPTPKTDMDNASGMFLFPHVDPGQSPTSCCLLHSLGTLAFMILLVTMAAALGCHLATSMSHLTSIFSSMIPHGDAGLARRARLAVLDGGKVLPKISRGSRGRCRARRRGQGHTGTAGRR
jgi:hypothetical protein